VSTIASLLPLGLQFIERKPRQAVVSAANSPIDPRILGLLQEREGLDDNLPSDYLIRVQQGGF